MVLKPFEPKNGIPYFLYRSRHPKETKHGTEECSDQAIRALQVQEAESYTRSTKDTHGVFRDSGGGGGTYHVSEFFRVRNFVPLARIVDTCEEIHMPSPARLFHGLHVLTQRDYMDILEV